MIFRSIAHAVAPIAVALALATGCTPVLDWREIKPSGAGFRVLLPAKPSYDSQPLSATTGNPRLHLWSTQAADTVFGAGYADLQATDATVLAALRDGLVRNIGGRIESEHDIVAAGIAGIEFSAEGLIGGAPAMLRARLLVSEQRLYQIAAIGRTGALPAEELDMFFNSFQVSPR